MSRRRTHLYTAAALAAVVAVAVTATVVALRHRHAVTTARTVAPGDPTISYVGRWDTRAAGGYVPEWAGAYLATRFAGSGVALRQRGPVDLYVSVDGGPDVLLSGVQGLVPVSPAPLKAGTHTLRVAYRSGDMVFGGLVLDPGARTLREQLPGKLVEFVGDSITEGYLDSQAALSAYGWLVGERLGVRHTQIARSGYCLVSQPDCPGQDTQYFKQGATGDTAWDFQRYRATAVVINLGTNDAPHGVLAVLFQASYVAFLHAVRVRYPNAVIFAMETFRTQYAAQTRAAVAAVNRAGDPNVVYVKTEGWLVRNVDYVDGDIHPNDNGQAKIAARLAPIIAARIGAGPQ